ncbi:MAG: cobalamin biosynthesis protein P47K [Clostridiales bacterium]|nr:cobalamin biosynthesis protein P47K [Clostridiales bacterium]
MKVIVLAGFLGSGKTSVLLKLAKYIVKRDGEEGRTSVAIIENEIGEVGVDDKILRSQGLAVRELFAGCACCTGGADLLSDINTIKKEMDPKWIIVESTGVAYPLLIKENVQSYIGVDVIIIGLADAQRWRRLKNAMAHLIESQLEHADSVLLNKVDLVDEDTAEIILSEIEQINPAAKLYKTIANKTVDDSVWESVV